MKKLLLLLIPFLMLSCQAPKSPSAPISLGYEMENDKKIDIAPGETSSTAVIEAYFKAYNERDLDKVASLEHSDATFYAPNGTFVDGSEEHIAMSKKVLSSLEYAQWDLIWSISTDIRFETKPTENWVTTCLNVTTGKGDDKTTVQRIVDAQIVDQKIKKVFLYQRTMTEKESQ